MTTLWALLHKKIITLAMTANVHRILAEMKAFPDSAIKTPSEYFSCLKCFTRTRILTLNILCFFIIGQSKRSLSVELVEYFARLKLPFCTKSAFSKARYRILPAFFVAWNKTLIDSIYAKPKNMLRWKGYYIKGVDGSTIALFNDPDVIKEFGTQSNQHKSIAMARVGLVFDALNGYCTQATIQPFSVGENQFAVDFLEDSLKEDILVYDRYFASFELIFRHLSKERAFVMRCKVDFNSTVSDFVKRGKKQEIVTFPITSTALQNLSAAGFDVNNKTVVKVRLLRIDIGTAEPEILITSLLNMVAFPHDCFKELYFMRWGVETAFDKLKNKFQIGAFSGHKPAAIYQDFYSTIIACNLQNLICGECLDELNTINENRDISVNINQNVSIGLFKPRLVLLFIGNKAASVFKELKKLFLSFLEPVRPNRSYPRTKTVRLKGKYRTYMNYRRGH